METLIPIFRISKIISHLKVTLQNTKLKQLILMKLLMKKKRMKTMTMNLFHQRSLFLHNQAMKKMNMKMAKSIGGTLLRIWNLAWVEINLDYLVYIDHLKN